MGTFASAQKPRHNGRCGHGRHLLPVLSVIVAIILTQYELELIFALLPLIPFVYFLALLLVTVLRTAKYRAKLCVAFFGEKNPAEGKAPLISFDPFGKK